MEGLDVLAAIKGTDKVLLDTVMQPEVLEQQMQQINDIYFQVFDELYDIIREGDEMAFCYFSSWAPGKMSKLQSDISTMISVDDYRRFVQPFIREQCQKISYTVYHLDGIGAMHHLDALLEIEELNAIQWTPGVGEPQGGSPKWYDLYNKILAGGKSIMACWVTLDELKPLLDHIGGEGVHIEMDFHNEREVEQAMRIVEEYQSKDEDDRKVEEIIRLTENQSGKTRISIDEIAKNRILVLDGAMGTMIQQSHLNEADFRGTLFVDHGFDLKGCNDVLSLTAPHVIRDIHRRYLEAGADLIETNTFNAQRISMQDYGLSDHCRDMNLAAARITRELADEYTARNPQKPRFVLGSIGPTSRTTSVATSGEPLDESLLEEAYAEQIQALSDGGVDALLIETIFDVKNAEIAIKAAKRTAPLLPIMLSFSVSTPDGHNMLGQSIIEFVSTHKGDMTKMEMVNDRVHLEFTIPSRGIMGMRTYVMNVSAGEAIMAHRFLEYQPWKGDIVKRNNGSLIAMEGGTAYAYALDKLQDRGKFFIDPQEEVYAGQVVGENAKEGDIVINVTKSKKLTNMRSKSADDKAVLPPPVRMSLEEALEYIKEDEYVEVTPHAMRIRKIILDELERKRAGRV
jgi:methionine synthase I (cobalamin-dependent)